MLKLFKFFTFLSVMLIATETANALTARSAASDYVSENTYNNLYPYMNNTMRTNLNPGTTPSQSNAPINVLTRTKTTNNTTSRNVVPRGTTTTSAARSATNTSPSSASGTTRRVSARPQTSVNSTARSGTSTGSTTARAASNINSNSSTSSSTRRVVARSGTGTSTVASANRTSSRSDGNVSDARQTTSTAVYTTTGTPVSSARCMADYAACMNSYCEREDTEYNRCYCSSKLAQIDAQYKPEIDRLIKEILTVQNDNYLSDEEMNEYWMETVGKYTGENSWQNLEDALNIDWSSTESRVRGQQAFVTGHEYCVQHLTGCAYMQTNLRDAYRSDIARDCATYESSLQRLKNAAESIVESYK